MLRCRAVVRVSSIAFRCRLLRGYRGKEHICRRASELAEARQRDRSAETESWNSLNTILEQVLPAASMRLPSPGLAHRHHGPARDGLQLSVLKSAYERCD